MLRVLWIAAAVLLVAAAGAVGYALGSEAAPGEADAASAYQLAYEQNLDGVQDEAAARAHEEGLASGVQRGKTLGSQDGASAGAGDGERKAEDRLVEIEVAEAAAAAAAATPEDTCRHLIDNPDAYGVCLQDEGQDPGAPLTDYCAANPEIVAMAGYCPSLNE
jgi:hypothetical protein